MIYYKYEEVLYEENYNGTSGNEFGGLCNQPSPNQME